MANDARPAEKIELQHVEPTHTDAQRGYRHLEQPKCSQGIDVSYEVCPRKAPQNDRLSIENRIKQSDTQSTVKHSTST